MLYGDPLAYAVAPFGSGHELAQPALKEFVVCDDAFETACSAYEKAATELALAQAAEETAVNAVAELSKEARENEHALDEAIGELGIVAPAQRSPRAESEALSKKTSDGEPVHSFKTLLRDLATVVKNRIQPKAEGTEPFDITTTPTSHQKRAIDLLKIRL